MKEVEARWTTKIDDVEARMTAKIDDVEARMTAKIDDVEARMTAKIDDVEARMIDRIAASESKIMAYIESDVMPRFGILADGHMLLNETLAPKSRVEKLEEEVAFLKPLVLSTFADVEELKKAQ